MSKAEDRAKYLGYGTDPLNRAEYTANEVREAFIDGYNQAMEDVIEWIDNHWREYVNVDADGVVCFGHWKNDLIKAMKDE